MLSMIYGAGWVNSELWPSMKRVEQQLPSLKHLLTNISLTAEMALDVEKLTRALHPTPALGGFPRAQAMRWLQSQPEAVFRRRFGAPFGYVDGDFAHVVVAIRGLQLHSGRWWLASGCGVVEGSVPEREWSELALKRESIRRSMGIQI